MKKMTCVMAIYSGLLLASAPSAGGTSVIEKCQRPLLAELSKVNKLEDPIKKQVEQSRLNFYLGRCAFLEEQSELSLPFFERGEKNAEAVLEVKSDEPVALFWWVANKGTLADISRGVSALKTIKTIEEKLLLIADKIPDYAFAGADRVLGKIYDKAPRFISIGSSSKAEKHLKAAFNKFPQFPGNIIALAEFYDGDDRESEAKKLLLPLVKSHQIQKGDYGSFNVEKDEWGRLVKALMKKWSVKSE